MLRLRWSTTSQCRFALCRPSLFLSTLLLAIQVRPGENIVEFWTQSKNLFPRLHSVFLKLCCVPASSAASERDFSAAGFILNNRRSSLDPKIVKDLMLIACEIFANSISIVCQTFVLCRAEMGQSWIPRASTGQKLCSTGLHGPNLKVHGPGRAGPGRA